MIDVSGRERKRGVREVGGYSGARTDDGEWKGMEGGWGKGAR